MNWRRIAEVSLCKTLRFNFTYLPWRQALKLPVLVSRHCRFRRLAGNVHIEAPVCMGMIRLGFDGVGIFDNQRSRTIWQVNGMVVFRGTAMIGHGSKISVDEGGSLSLGDNFRITAESTIVVARSVIFGDDCLCSWDNLIMDTDFHRIEDACGEWLNADDGITIGDHVWIGCRSTILKGVNLPDGTIVAAGSVVLSSPLLSSPLLSSPLLSSPLLSSPIVGGNPAKIIKTNVTWKI